MLANLAPASTRTAGSLGAARSRCSCCRSCCWAHRAPAVPHQPVPGRHRPYQGQRFHEGDPPPV